MSWPPRLATSMTASPETALTLPRSGMSPKECSPCTGLPPTMSSSDSSRTTVTPAGPVDHAPGASAKRCGSASSQCSPVIARNPCRSASMARCWLCHLAHAWLKVASSMSWTVTAPASRSQDPHHDRISGDNEAPASHIPPGPMASLDQVNSDDFPPIRGKIVPANLESSLGARDDLDQPPGAACCPADRAAEGLRLGGHQRAGADCGPGAVRRSDLASVRRPGDARSEERRVGKE